MKNSFLQVVCSSTRRTYLLVCYWSDEFQKAIMTRPAYVQTQVVGMRSCSVLVLMVGLKPAHCCSAEPRKP